MNCTLCCVHISTANGPKVEDIDSYIETFAKYMIHFNQKRKKKWHTKGCGRKKINSIVRFHYLLIHGDMKLFLIQISTSESNFF